MELRPRSRCLHDDTEDEILSSSWLVADDEAGVAGQEVVDGIDAANGFTHALFLLLSTLPEGETSSDAAVFGNDVGNDPDKARAMTCQ